MSLQPEQVDWKQVAQKLHEDSCTIIEASLKSDNGSDLLQELQRLKLLDTVSDTTREIPINPQEKQLLELQAADTNKALEALEEHQASVRELQEVQARLRKDQVIGSAQKVDLLRAIYHRKKELDQKLDQVRNLAPECFLTIAAVELLAAKTQYDKGRIIITPFVDEKLNEIIDALEKQKKPFVYGETGTGKTEIARIAIRKFTGKDELLIRGFPGMGSEELFGHKELKNDIESLTQQIDKQIDLLQSFIGTELTPEERKSIAISICAHGGCTITGYILGMVYRGAQEGRGVIIDEATYIPPGLLAKLNDIQTKKTGEFIDVQEDGMDAIEVQEGFCLVFNGNINQQANIQRYLERQDLDLAFQDRVEKIDYNFLPQASQGEALDHDVKDKQLFFVTLVTQLFTNPEAKTSASTTTEIDRVENRLPAMYIPGGAEGLNKLWRFAKYASICQNAFTGEIDSSDSFSLQINGTSIGNQTEINLSNRRIISILEAWKEDGYIYELDHYLYKQLISQALRSIDRAHLYQVGQKCKFFLSDGWTQNPEYSNAHEHFKINAPKNPAAKPEFIPGIAIVETLYGQIPERSVWPNGQTAAITTTQNQAALAIEIQAERNRLNQERIESIKPYLDILPKAVVNEYEQMLRQTTNGE